MSSPRDRPVTRWRRGATAASVLALALVAALLTAAPAAGSHGGAWHTVERVSVSSSGAEGNGPSFNAALSADGRFVAFASYASNLVASDTNETPVIFVRDRLLGTTERVSISTAGDQANNGSVAPFLSSDGRFVAFSSLASNLVAGDTNRTWDVFVRDRLLGTTERVSVSSSGFQMDVASYFPSMSSDGHFVAFESTASKSDPSDKGGIFVHDRLLQNTELISVSNAGHQANDESSSASLSADGRFVAFLSRASNLVESDTNGLTDVFVFDRLLRTMDRISVSNAGEEANGRSDYSSINADGRFVAFWSFASNLVEGDTNDEGDIFVRDRELVTTERINVPDVGAPLNDTTFGHAVSVSANGRLVAFESGSLLVPGDTNEAYDIFVHDRLTGSTSRVNISSTGDQANGGSHFPSFSTDGGHVVFHSYASNLIEGDANSFADIFVSETQPNQPPSVTAAPSRTLLYTHRTWTLRLATFTDPYPGDTHTATVDWGDGIVTSGIVDEQAGTVTGAHRYTAPGAYTVAVTVRDAAGGEGAASFQVVVRPHPRLRR